MLKIILPKKPVFIIADRANQLGNRLFLFAHFIACGIENNYVIINPCFEEYAHFFKTTSLDLFCRYPFRESMLPKDRITRKYVSKFISKLASSLAGGKIKNFNSHHLKVIQSGYETTLEKSDQDKSEIEFYLDNREFLNSIDAKQIILFRGPLFRDFSSFIKHSDKIRDYFKPLEIFQHNIDNLIIKVREHCNIVVGVHIRQGDYINFLEGRYFYTLDQYLTIMAQVKNLFSHNQVAFLICSNVKQEERLFAKFQCFFGRGHIVEDMYLLAQCDYIIGPPSTYSAWGSFYGEVPRYSIINPTKMLTIDEFQTVTS